MSPHAMVSTKGLPWGTSSSDQIYHASVIIDTRLTAEALGSIGKLDAQFSDPTQVVKVEASVSKHPAPPPVRIDQALLRTTNQ